MNFSGLLEPQHNHAKKLLNSLFLNGVALDQSHTGTGKTYVGAWLAKQMASPVVVICPRAVKKTWRDTLLAAGVENPLIINYELIVRGNTEFLQYDMNLFHRTNEWWKSEGITINLRKDSFVIVDEIHRARGQKSLTADMVIALTNLGYKTLGCSATAATSVADMKALAYALRLHNGSNFKQWCFDHGAQYNEYGTITWDGDQTPAKEGMARIHSLLFDELGVSSRMHRDDFGGLFPQNRVFADVFDLGANTKKVQAAYDLMEFELAALDKRATNYKNHIFAIQMKVRRHTELLKVPAMVEWANDAYDEGLSPVLFINFQDTADALAVRLGTKKLNGKLGFLNGSQTEAQNNEAVELFQADKYRVMAVNSQAGNMGISLHDLHGKYPRTSLLNPSWSAYNFMQSLGRIPRLNGKTPCLQRFMYANVPIEERMAGRLETRIGLLETLNEGAVSDEDLDFMNVLA